MEASASLGGQSPGLLLVLFGRPGMLGCGAQGLDPGEPLRPGSSRPVNVVEGGGGALSVDSLSTATPFARVAAGMSGRWPRWLLLTLSPDREASGGGGRSRWPLDGPVGRPPMPAPRGNLGP